MNKFLRLKNLALICFVALALAPPTMPGQAVPDNSKVLGAWDVEVYADGQYFNLILAMVEAEGKPAANHLGSFQIIDLLFPEFVAAADAQDLAEKDAVEIPLRVVFHDLRRKKVSFVQVLPVYFSALNNQVCLLETGGGDDFGFYRRQARERDLVSIAARLAAQDGHVLTVFGRE